jgi:hypothetical protein
LPVGGYAMSSASGTETEYYRHIPSARALKPDLFLVECLAWGILRIHGVEGPPVPVRNLVEDKIPVFENLTLLEMNLGLYKAAYRSCLDGSRVIVIDPTASPDVQREGIARELYVAFCRSARGAELAWPQRSQPRTHCDFFARCLLTPALWVQQACAQNLSVEGLAARFGVSIELMTRRLNEVNLPHSGPGGPELLVQTMFSLKEPWRGRFLDLVTAMATSKTKAKEPPSPKQVATWLSASPGLYQDIKYLLNAWQSP